METQNVEEPFVKDKTILITGANTGIGKVAALELAQMGARVVMLCRSAERGERARQEIQEQSGNSQVDLIVADLSSFAQIRTAVAEFKEKYKQLHLLLNNAGLTRNYYKTTEEGYESIFTVNHLGPFLLTNLLLDVIRASAPARIVNVSSMLHRFDDMNLEDLWFDKKGFNGTRAYSRSKLANVLFTYELDRRLKDDAVTANCLHPGVIFTELVREYPPFAQNLLGFFLKSPKKGARTSVYLANAPELKDVSGKYFVDCKLKKSSQVSYDTDKARQLWDISEKLTGLQE